MRSPSRATTLRAQWLHVASMSLLVLVSLLQRPGKTTFDTKFDLTADPIGALSGAFTFWNPGENLGGISNQAYGYLFPQGAWFALMDVLAAPDWIAQRVWSALVLVAAYEGTRRLARALGLGRRTAPVLAGLAYALCPRILGLVGVLSAEVLPSALLPWVCLPLVLALLGRMPVRRAAFLSATAVLFMGGVNAAENLATFPLPAALVLSGCAQAAGRRLAAWWALATSLASLWWLLPVLLLGRYSPPFLDYIETAYATTRTTGWSNSVRGSEHWVGFIVVGGEPWWPAANDLGTNAALVVVTAVVAGIGLLGVFWRGMPFRLPFAISVVIGMVCLTVGHAGALESPIAESVRSMLDGPLAAFRNVHKVDPLVRLPLALGLAHACLVAWRVTNRLSSRQRSVRPAWVRPVAVGCVLALLLASAAPMFANRLRKPGWDQVPQAWYQAVDWIEEDGPGATLVLPATAFAQQRWGTTVDEPIQGLSDVPWVARTQIPLVPATTIRWLDSIETRLESGVGSRALAATLASAGITRILLRRDLDTQVADTADPDRVSQALMNSPGIYSVAEFGRTGFGDQPLIEVLRIVPSQSGPSAQVLAATPTLYGAPDDIIAAGEAGLIRSGQHVLVGPDTDGPSIVADGYRRQERQFGRFHDAVSEVMTPDDPYRAGRVEPDYAGVDGVDRVVADYSGARRVLASSSSGYADSVGPIRPELGPASAVDGDPTSFWQSAPFEEQAGQWLEIDLGSPRLIDRVVVDAGVDGVSGVPVTQIEVTVGDQTVNLPVGQRTGRAVAVLEPVRADRVRVTVREVATSSLQGVAIREVAIPGHEIRRTLDMPSVGADDTTSFLFTSRAPRRACVGTPYGTSCDAFAARSGDEGETLRRSFTVLDPGAWRMRGTVVARPTPETAELFEPLGPGLWAHTNSVLGGDPAAAGIYAVDGDPSTAWLASYGDTAPALDVSWGRERRIDRLQVVRAPGDRVRPTRALITTADGRRRVVDLGSGGLGFFAPLVADGARIEFRSKPALDQTPVVGVGELRIGGLEGMQGGFDPNTRTGAVCGLGPEVSVDGRTYSTYVRGTLGDVLLGTPVKWRTCGVKRVPLGTGTHEVAARATRTFAPTTLGLVARASPQVTHRAVEGPSGPGAGDYRIAGGPESLFTFGSNFNRGWSAVLDGEELEPVLVDGWQQGFVVPAGGGGVIRISYPPDSSYTRALIVGLAGAIAVLGGLCLSVVRPGSRLVPTRGRAQARLRPRGRWLAGSAMVVAGGVLGGWVPALAVLAGVLFGARQRAVMLVAAALVVASGIAAAFSDGLGRGLPSVGADALAAVGVGLLVSCLLPQRERKAIGG